MSRDGSLSAPFGDAGDEFFFRIAYGELIKLQESRDCGPLVVLDRLHSGRWLVEDIREVIRIGLIGGGMDPAKALKLVRRYMEGRPPFQSLELAQRILAAGLVGAEDEQLEKKAVAPDRPNESTISPTGNGGSESSTATGP